MADFLPPYTGVKPWEVSGEAQVAACNNMMSWFIDTATPKLNESVSIVTGDSSVRGNYIDDPLMYGNTSKKHVIIGGVLRRDTGTTDAEVVDANNWYWINDTTHIPLNIDFTQGDNANTTQGGCSLESAGAYLKIYYHGARLNTLQVTPDETFAKKGLICGNSTGYNNAVLTFVAPCHFTCDLNTIEISELDSDIWGAILGNTRFSVSKSNGYITVTHPPLNNEYKEAFVKYKGIVSTRPQFIPLLQSSSGGSTTLFLLGQHEGQIGYLGGGVWGLASCEVHDDTNYTFAYDAPSGVLTVTHPTSVSLTAPTLQLQGIISDENSPEYVYTPFSFTTTTFKVKIRDTAGGIPATTTNIKFLFNRGLTAKVDDSKIDGSLYVDIGHAQCLAKDINSNIGNFWVSGVTEVD